MVASPLDSVGMWSRRRPRLDLRLGLSTLAAVLSLASISCCVAMAMPLVHIVADCRDLG